jgi:hypothetical protein
MEPPRTKENLPLQLIGVFAVCLVGYILLYSCDSRLRAGKGAWSVRFDTTTNDTPRIVINQAALGISNVTITFPGETVTLTNGPTDLVFTSPTLEPPFGELRHHDLMYLPGVITLLAFNHEIELIPRGLFIDRHAVRKRTKDLK